MRRRRLLTVLILLLLAAPLVADSVYLTSGTCLKGTITAEHPDRIEIRLESGEVKTIPRSEIAVIKKGTAPTDEYQKRLKAVDDKDLDALLDLAAWCQENNLKRQSSKVLRKALKLDEDCPMARRALLMVWNGSKWTKDKKKSNPTAPTSGSQITRENVGLKLKPLSSWPVKDIEKKTVLLTGPDRYRHPVTIEILLSPTAPDDAFKDEAVGWSAPKEVTYGKLAGFVAERTHGEKRRLVRVREYALAGNGWQHTVRLTSLDIELDDWVPYVELVLKSFVVLAPKLDFENPELGFGFSFPQDDNWKLSKLQIRTDIKIDVEAGKVEFKVKEIGASVTHQGEGAMEWANVRCYVETVDEGADADTALQSEFEPDKADVKSRSDSRLGGLPARIWVVETLQRGIPVRGIYLAAVKGKTAYVLAFVSHERTTDTFRHCFEKIRTTFTLLK